MILKGNQRGGGKALAVHLMNARDNDHVELHELRGFASQDLKGAFLEIEAAAKGTKCQQPFFSVSLNPPTDYPASFDQFEMAADAIEEKYPALADQPRAIVFHEKEGRRPGIKDPNKANPLNYDPPTWQQAKRLGEDPRDLKAIIRQAWSVSDSRASFERALERHALYLAQGDRRGFVVVHHSGEVLSLSRYSGIKTKEITARIGRPAEVPTVDQVRDVLRARMTSTIEKRLDDMKKRHARELRPIHDRIAKMKEVHQEQRQAMRTRQAARLAAEELTRANRLRKGVMGLWDRLSGRRGKVSELNAVEAKAGRVRDREERQGLIAEQKKERTELQTAITKVRDRHQHERQYHRAELAVMLSMMADHTREDFQEHAKEIDVRKGTGLVQPAEQDATASPEQAHEGPELTREMNIASGANGPTPE